MYLLASIILATLLLLQSSQPGVINDKNLFEFSVVSYGEGGSGIPFPGPPEIKVYESGRIVFRENNRYIEGHLASKELSQLRKRLSQNPLLATSHVVEVSRGQLPGLHGGFALIRYLEDDSQILLVSNYVPTRGSLAKLLSDVRSVRPKQVQPFSADVLTLITNVGNPEACTLPQEQNRVWPFGERVQLRTLLRNPTPFNDAAISRYLFPNGISSFLFDFCEDGKRYSLYVVGVADWKSGDEQLGAALEGQALMDKNVHAGR